VDVDLASPVARPGAARAERVMKWGMSLVVIAPVLIWLALVLPTS
jgi:hypothetical protein